jgi:SAM-dependent methyltransferase
MDFKTKYFVRKQYNSVVDSFEVLTGKRNREVPPRTRRAQIGDGDFEAIGVEYLDLLVDIGGLRPDDRVLDVGCGIGRIAIPLTGFFSGKGSYEGFDIVSSDIRWLNKHVGGKHPNFNFSHADIYNRMYNPGGKTPASEYTFPYEDRSFDFVFAASLFTHLVTSDARRYLEQIARVLEPGGRSLVSFFLLNDETARLIADGGSRFDFSVEMEGCRAQDADIPEIAVAYEESTIVELYADLGMPVSQPVHYGAWCGRSDFTSGQDLVVTTRRV